MAEEKGLSFDKKMRAATKEIHSVSDALVNAKLALGLSSKEVWSEGLLVFYEVFRYLEEAVDRHKGSLIEEIFIDDMRRTEAFEQDLKYYLGPYWKCSYTARDSVISYLNHLIQIEKEDPNLLIAYIYHLYMGLLSGGQILRFKRGVSKKIGFNSTESSEGNCVTDFSPLSISTLKKQLRENLNTVAERMSKENRIKLIEESKTVFLLNNEIIKSVKSIDDVLHKKLMLFVFGIILILFAYFSWTDDRKYIF